MLTTTDSEFQTIYTLTTLPGDERNPRAVINHPKPQGSRNRKKLAGGVAVTGMAYEKYPVPSSVPVLFVVQLVIGNAKLVVVSQV